MPFKCGVGLVQFLPATRTIIEINMASKSHMAKKSHTQIATSRGKILVSMVCEVSVVGSLVFPLDPFAVDIGSFIFFGLQIGSRLQVRIEF